MARYGTEQNFIDNEINQALTRRRLPHYGPLREALNRDAFVTGERNRYYVRVSDEVGSEVSLDERISQLKNDPRYRHYFPADLPIVARSDNANLKIHFDEIASGKVRVE